MFFHIVIYLGPVSFSYFYTGVTGFVLAYVDAGLPFPHVQLLQLTIITIERVLVCFYIQMFSYLND